MQIIAPYDAQRTLVMPALPAGEQPDPQLLKAVETVRQTFLAPMVRITLDPSLVTVRFNRPGTRPARDEVREYRWRDNISYYFDYTGHLWEMSITPLPDASLRSAELEKRAWQEAIHLYSLPGLTRELLTVLDKLVERRFESRDAEVDVIVRVLRLPDYYDAVFAIERRAAPPLGVAFNEWEETNQWLDYWRAEPSRACQWFQDSALWITSPSVSEPDCRQFIAEWSLLAGIVGMNIDYFKARLKALFALVIA